MISHADSLFGHAPAIPQGAFVPAGLTKTPPPVVRPVPAPPPANDSFSIAYLSSKKSDVTSTQQVTFEQLADILGDVKKGKKDGRAWMPAAIEKGARNAKRVQGINFLVIDVEADTEDVYLDELDANGKKQKALDEFGDIKKNVIGDEPPPVGAMASLLQLNCWRSIVHTSYSHSTEHPRYRIVISLSRSLLPVELKDLGQRVAKKLGIEKSYDAGALESARLYYLPRCPSDERLALFEVVRIEGDALDVDSLLRVIAPPPPLPPPSAPLHPPAPAQATQSVCPTVSDPHLIGDLRSALGQLDADDRKMWVANGQRLKSLGDAGFALWTEWAKTSDKWSDGDDAEWDTFAAERTGHGAIFEDAQALGWVNPATIRKKQSVDALFDPVTGAPLPNPLLKVVNINDTPRPPDWILPNFIAEGIVLIAGGHGVGKTTTLLPLAMTAAGLHEVGYQLAPKHWRHVVYITEDVAQAKRIIAGIAPAIGLDGVLLAERLHIVEAARLPVERVVEVGQHYKTNYSRIVPVGADEVELLPLVVIDTMAATFQLENENDNAEASRMVAALKQQFVGLPVWIVGHVNKGDLSKDGAKSGAPTMRGASAFEADANQVLYLVKDDDVRWLVRGKSRFESLWHELIIESDFKHINVVNRFGDYESLTLRWAIARPSVKTRTEINVEAKQEETARADAERKELIFKLVADAELDAPLNKTGVASAIGGNRQSVYVLIDELVNQNRLVEITIPSKMRKNPKQESYLVSLDSDERDAYAKTGELPEAKKVIHPHWVKQG